MTTSMLACGKANAYGSLKVASVAGSRLYSSAHANGKSQPRAEDAAVQRELFVNVLNANATKRDAKQYLARFKGSQPTGPKPDPQVDRDARHRKDQDRLDRIGVNLGGLYAPARAIADSPQFTQHRLDREQAQRVAEPQMHVALVCLKNAGAIDDATLDGLAVTVSQLVKLDMRIVLVLDTYTDHQDASTQQDVSTDVRAMRTLFARQALRINEALERHNTSGARFIPGTLEQDGDSPGRGGSTPLKITLPKLLFDPLKRSVVPIIPPLAYSPTGQLIRVSASDVMVALTRRFTGPFSVAGTGNAYHETSEKTYLDRIIVLDPLGGIPSKDRGDGAHVFINLEQEYPLIKAELDQYASAMEDNDDNRTKRAVYGQHLNNLDITERCLRHLPSDSSALIITPQEAATSALARRSQNMTIGTGTRSQRNSLIHNLLTNKPMVSSSLPTARLPSSNHADGKRTVKDIPAATLVKRGMPVTMIPVAERARGWQLPKDGVSDLKLEDDTRIDFARLLHLIENSFRRKLDVHDYFTRIDKRIAGIIVAGEYEGGAILTWEMPPGTNDPTRLVPYLDKFAVLQSSQGSSGVADIVFQSMVRTCFPHGVCWRSRKDNPVNKWYFERSAGSWQIPASNWTMFWTGEGVVENEQRWNDYVSVCKSVQPSWADGKKPD